MIVQSDLWRLAAEHLFSFGFGLVAGFVAANRWKIMRRERLTIREPTEADRDALDHWLGGQEQAKGEDK